MKQYLTEFIGTLFLALTVSLAGRSDLAPLAVAAVLMIMVYTGGYISGAHYNPAVSFSLALSRVPFKAKFWGYICSQILGAVAGAMIAKGIGTETLAPFPTQPILFASLLAEIVFTFLLSYTVLHVATRKESNQYYGIAIGSVLLVAAVVAGPISGAVLNPALGIAAMLTSMVTGGSYPLSSMLLYIVGPLTGGLLAAAVYGVQKN
ncbi:MAG: aquaporin [Candidatus Woesebacteria bacterium]